MILLLFSTNLRYRDSNVPTLTSSVIFCYLYRDKEFLRSQGQFVTIRIMLKFRISMCHGSRASSDGIARLGHGLYDRGAAVQFPLRTRDYLLSTPIQTGYGACPASYTTSFGGCFRWGKPEGTWSWPLTSIYYEGQEWWRYTSTLLYVFIVRC
jgi:hypothetical protein